MFSLYPSQCPVQFPDTQNGLVAMLAHDHEWATGSGYLDDEGQPFDEAAIRAAYRVDSNGNLIRLDDPQPDGLQVVRLVEGGRVWDGGRGYVVDATCPGGFGDDECPSSAGRPCEAWFGEGEAYASQEDALAAIRAED